MRVKRAVGLFKSTFQDWLQDGCMRLAAALSYYSLISLAPLLVVAVGLVGMILGRSAAQGKIVEEVTKAVGPGAAAVVQSMIDSQHFGGFGLAAALSGLILLIGASGIFAELKADLNIVWDVPPKNQKTGAWAWIRTRLLAFLMVLIIGALLLATLLVTPALNIVLRSAESITPFSGVLLRVGDLVVTVGIVAVLCALVYKLLPDIEVSWKDVWVGAVVTAALFTVGKYGLAYYLSHSAVASSYGAAGSVVTILIFTYYSWLLLLLGAEFTEKYSRTYGSRAGESTVRGEHGRAEPEPLRRPKREPAWAERSEDAEPAGIQSRRSGTNLHGLAATPHGARAESPAAPRVRSHSPASQEPSQSDEEGRSMATQTEIEYLQEQADAARSAMQLKLSEAKSCAGRAANPIAWVREYPKVTAGVVGGIGLATGALLLSKRNRRKARRGLHDLFTGRTRARIKAERVVSRDTREHRGLLAALMAAAAAAVAPLIKTALQTAITSAVSTTTATMAAKPEAAESSR